MFRKSISIFGKPLRVTNSPEVILFGELISLTKGRLASSTQSLPDFQTSYLPALILKAHIDKGRYSKERPASQVLAILKGYSQFQPENPK